MSTTVRYPVIRNARSSHETIDHLIRFVDENPNDLLARHALAEELEDLDPDDWHTGVWYGSGDGDDLKSRIAELRNPNARIGAYQIVRDNIRMGGEGPLPHHQEGYPLVYLTSDNGDLCHNCVNSNIRRIADEIKNPDHHDQFRVVHHIANFENDDLHCDHCGNQIESAYGGDNANDNAGEELPGVDDQNFDDRYDERGRTITGTSYVNTDNEGPQRMSRIKYAAPAEKYVPMTPEQEEAALLEGIHKNPDDLSIRHAYAEVLDEQGRYGEAAFHAAPIMESQYPDMTQPEYGPYWHNVYQPPKWATDGWGTAENQHGIVHGIVEHGTIPRIALLITVHPHGPLGSRHSIMKDFTIPDADHVLKELERQGVKAEGGPWQEAYRNQIAQKMNTSYRDTPVRHSAYRAPKGGAVVRGTYYQGGKLIPDLEGDFANPPAPEQPVTPTYPQPKSSLRDRLKAKFGQKEPLVVSYARSPKSKPPEHLPKLFDAVRRLDYINPDLTIRNALAEELADLGRHKEVELLNSGRYAIDLNGGGKVVKAPPPPAINTATRRGIGYRQLREQLDHGRTRRIGNNREIANGPDGDIHVHLHGNHVVTAHPDGSYSLFAGQWHTPTTFAVHQEMTGERPNRVRGVTMFRGEPFEEGVRFTPGQDG